MGQYNFHVKLFFPKNEKLKTALSWLLMLYLSVFCYYISLLNLMIVFRALLRPLQP